MNNIITNIITARSDALWALAGTGPIGEALAADVWDVVMAGLQARQFADYISMREDWPCDTWCAFLALLKVRPWRAMHRGTIAPWRLVAALAASYEAGNMPV